MKNLVQFPHVGTQKEYRGRQLCNEYREVISAPSIMLRRLPNNTVCASHLDISALGVPYFHIFPGVSCLSAQTLCPDAQ